MKTKAKIGLVEGFSYGKDVETHPDLERAFTGEGYPISSSFRRNFSVVSDMSEQIVSVAKASDAVIHSVNISSENMLLPAEWNRRQESNCLHTGVTRF